MAHEFTRELGRRYGRTYRLRYRGTPSLNEPVDWCVAVYFTDSTGSGVDIVRVDTAHGSVHVDRLYRQDRPTDTAVTVDDIWSAGGYLEDNWRRFAETHRENHEDCP